MDHHDHHAHHQHAAATAAVTTTTAVPSFTRAMFGGHEHHMDDMSNMTNCEKLDAGQHVMEMTFHFGHCENVLFDWWQIRGPGSLIGSMIGIFIIAALYEGLKYYREYLFWRSNNAVQYRTVSPPPQKTDAEEQQKVVKPSMLSKIHGLQTGLHVIQIIISYLLMLIFMTYNSWLCLAVVAGATLGYFLFGWKKSVIVDVTEHCH
ncbi:hypothetical protein B566_EDAN004154 [Ephemera danica]|nr:hypothetical protein B566_EDAN004154 [Ephemera danica]